MTTKKYFQIIMGGFLFSSIIFIVLFQSTKACIQWQNQVLLWIFGLSITLAILIVILNTAALLNSFKRKFPALSSASPALNTALMIYFGVLIIGLSYYKELIKQMTWDPTVVALGVAVLAFGWTFVIQHLQEQTTIENQRKLESSISELDKKILTIDSKIDGLKRANNACLEKLEDLNKNLRDVKKEELRRSNMNSVADIPQWFKVVHWLADEVGKVIVYKVEVKQTKRGAFGFYAPKNFAFIRKRAAGNTIGISTKKEWADNAGVSHTTDRQTKNGWWGEPHVAWYIDVNDTARQRQMIGILAKTRQARHR